jgi:hypothetical protein
MLADCAKKLKHQEDIANANKFSVINRTQYNSILLFTLRKTKLGYKILAAKDGERIWEMTCKKLKDN